MKKVNNSDKFKIFFENIISKLKEIANFVQSNKVELKSDVYKK